MWTLALKLLGPLLVSGFGSLMKNKQLSDEQKKHFRAATQSMNHGGESARLRKAFKKLEKDIEFNPQSKPKA